MKERKSRSERGMVTNGRKAIGRMYDLKIFSSFPYGKLTQSRAAAMP
jgi:hypothetical protein